MTEIKVDKDLFAREFRRIAIENAGSLSSFYALRTEGEKRAMSSSVYSRGKKDGYVTEDTLMKMRYWGADIDRFVQT